MIAEIHGKISSNGTNLKETLEDELTGNIFGTLRYMPFNKGLKRILMHGLYPKKISETLSKVDCEYFNDNIEFWPYDEEGEIDILINLKNTIIGIEVKYTSYLSSDDDIEGHDENNKSYNQLARESRIISKKGANKEKVLLFVAPDRECSEVYNYVMERDILEDDVLFGYVSWESILECLTMIKEESFNEYEKIMIEDMEKLLIRKGFDRFKNFIIKDKVEEKWYEFGNYNEKIISFNNITESEIKEKWFEF